MQKIPLWSFFAELRGFEAKVFTKKVVKLRIFDILKIRLNLYFDLIYIEANVKKNLKKEVPSDFEDVENSEFDYFFGENFRFKAPQLSEKSSERYVLHI